ncbi:MAG TPA: DUF2231 domain-containing protein [Hanamia sp.]|jgi:uncharacterized membrane protein|nr:DUF2231 domain-containing protein [Hanamia sp.]
MYSKIKILGHPIHPMLIAFPVAFYTGALACFIAFSSNHNIFWFKAGYVANVAGVIMALVAAVPGFIDWLYIPSDSKAKKTGVFHLVCNVVALLLFAINLWMLKDKWNADNPAVGDALVLTGAGFVLTIVAGFLGWTLVQTHHVGVDMDAV